MLNLRKYSICYVLMIFSSTLFAQAQTISPPKSDTNFIDARGLRQGPWKVIDLERLSWTGQFKDGKPYGQFRYFNKDDKTATILDYFRDGFAAKVTHFHPNGNIRATGFYLDRIRDSAWQIYDTDGRLVERLNYLDGMRHGLAILYDKNGSPIDSMEWYRDLRNGRWWQKTANGGEQRTTYKLNLSHGIYEAFFADGNLSIQGYYEEGLKEGTWYFYHDNRLLDRVIQFKNNLILKKQVAINVNGNDILIDSDSVAFTHTNGRIVEIKMIDNTIYRPSQTFEQLVKSFDLDDFFLATPQFLAPFRLFDSLVMQDDEEDQTIQTLHAINPDFAEGIEEAERRSKQKALLILKIPTPYEIYVDGEVIGLLQNIANSTPIIEN